MAVETIRTGDLLSAQSSKALAKALNTFSSRQDVAASAISENPHFVVVPPHKSKLSVGIKVLGAVYAAGESMVVEVKAIKADGTVVDLSTTTLNSTNAGSVPTVIDATAGVDATKEIVAGDTLYVERTYTAGGGPTPATISVVTVQVE
jgi:hypothetical protein